MYILCTCIGTHTICVGDRVCVCVLTHTMVWCNMHTLKVVIIHLPSLITHPHSQIGGFLVAVIVSLSKLELRVRDLIRDYKNKLK